MITPEYLEVVGEVIEPDEAKAQPEQSKRIDEKVSRQLDFQPAQFFWRETVRPKYLRAEERPIPLESSFLSPDPVRWLESDAQNSWLTLSLWTAF